MPPWCRYVNWGNWDSLSELRCSLCERRLERIVLRPALLPVKTVQFIQFFHQVWRHTVKSLSLTECIRRLRRWVVPVFVCLFVCVCVCVWCPSLRCRLASRSVRGVGRISVWHTWSRALWSQLTHFLNRAVDNAERKWHTRSSHLGTQLIQFLDSGTQLVCPRRDW
jgi:hypothetical protein